MAHVCIDIDLSKYFCLMCLIQINNLRVFFKFKLLLWSLFNLQIYTHMYKFKPFPIFFIWDNSQLLCLVNKNVGTCTYIEDRKFPSESMYVPMYMCVFKFSSETTGPMKPKFM